MAAFDSNEYCNFNANSAKAVAGKDILLCIFDSTGSNLLAIAGQKSLSIKRSADSIDVTSKDTDGGWKSKISGMKEWSIDTDGIYPTGEASHAALGTAFDNGDPICLKVINNKKKKSMFGGLAFVTDYSVDAPFDDAMTYSISLDGNGPLTDLSASTTATVMPGSVASE